MVHKAAVRLACIALCGLVWAGCKKDEGELTADWNKHVEDAQKYGAKYPGFKAALDARTAEAQKIMEEAKGIKEADARAAKMAEANSSMTAIMPAFTDFEGAQKKLKEARDGHANMPPQLAKLGEATKQADAKATQMVADAKPANVGEAKGALEAATAVLNEAVALYGVADGFVKVNDELKTLMNDKDILKLPAGEVMPLMDGAKKAIADSQAAVDSADPANMSVVKTKVGDGQKILQASVDTLKKAKPAAPAAPATPPPSTPPSTPPPPATK